MNDERQAWRTKPQTWEKLKPAARRNRHNPTDAESLLWQALRGRQLHGLRFRRQHAIGPFIVDFYCAAARLVIEVDGPIHETIREDDANRQAYLENNGLKVLRFTNNEVVTSLPAVLNAIQAALST